MRDDGLSLESRRLIFEHIRSHPGIHYRGLCRDLSLGAGTVQYHLDWMLKAGLIAQEMYENQKGYFPKEMTQPERKLMRYLRRLQNMKIIIFLALHPGSSAKQIASTTDIPLSSVYYYLKKLLDGGVVVHPSEDQKSLFELFDAEGMAKLLVLYQPHRFEVLGDGIATLLGILRSRWSQPP